MSFVCKDPNDEYTFERVRWVVDLSNGERIYQDENRPGVNPKAWLRLREYVCENHLAITNLFLQFRSNIVTPLPKNAKGYYFVNAILAALGDGDQRLIHYFNIGYYDGDVIHITKWQAPELLQVDSEVRSPKSCLEETIIYDSTNRTGGLQSNSERSEHLSAVT
jgi:hypothetical protein